MNRYVTSPRDIGSVGHMKEIEINCGDRVIYLGSDMVRLSTGEKLSQGDEGKVVKIVPPRRGVGWIEVDDESYFDEDVDGYAVAFWPSWGRRIIRIENEGKTWRRA